ncbi:MAG: carbohydrate kinase family protein [Deltaproteobacteria bacterium]|nr:carbohydrate kinase family protein [Deltaproteobacteria bacterium]
MKAVCVGDLSVDSYVLQNAKFVGGISFNVAWNLKDCGHSPVLLSAVGDDAAGLSILTALRSANLEVHGVQSLPGATAVQKILLRPDGERKFDGYTSGVLGQFRLRDEDRRALQEAQLIHVPLSDGLEAVFADVAESSSAGIKAVDFSLDYQRAAELPELVRSYAKHFQVIFLGGTVDYQALFQSLSQQYPASTFVLTLGKAGVQAYREGKEYYCPAPLLSATVDTTGCGDAFQAAFLAEYCAGSEIAPALDAGRARAAKVASHLGATDCRL